MEPSRNLVLVHTEGWQSIADFQAIKRFVEETAPDIEVFIASNTSRSAYTRKKAASRPTLIFSPLRLHSFIPIRGKVYAGQPMSKLAEMQRLSEAGLPVPTFTEIRPNTALSPDIYGPYTIVKPAFGLASWGQGIELLRTEQVRYRPPSDFPEEHPGRLGPMIAQEFIDCGYAMTCRILTFFGTPIFSYCRESTRPLALDSAREPFVQADFMPSAPHMKRSINRDPDLLAFAASVHAAMPQVALQACDILRDRNGAFHILEINPGGGTWSFSNHSTEGYKAHLGVLDLASEFDAFRCCARILVDRTRLEAV